MKTRAKKASAPTPKPENGEQGASVQSLPPKESIPPQTMVLPGGLSSGARIVTMPNPATSLPGRYLLCPDRGFFEFTRVTAGKGQCRSWLIAVEMGSKADSNGPKEQDGYILQKPDLLVATPLDPVFLLISAMYDQSGKAEQEYLAISDHLAKLKKTSPHLRQVLQSNGDGLLLRQLSARLVAISDSIDMGDEMLYCLSTSKLAKLLIGKAKKVTANGLPPSLVDQFVKPALDSPVLSIRREDSDISVVAPQNGADSDSQPLSIDTSDDSQKSNTTASTTLSSTSTATTATTSASETVASLLQLRVAYDFLLRSYIPLGLQPELMKLFLDSKTSQIDWTVVDQHLEHVNKAKKDAQALRSLSDNISRKRSAADDDEAYERAEAKKRKKAEEDLRKKNMSQGIKKLSKADTSGMKKLSSFFTKK